MPHNMKIDILPPFYTYPTYNHRAIAPLFQHTHNCKYCTHCSSQDHHHIVGIWRQKAATLHLTSLKYHMCSSVTMALPRDRLGLPPLLAAPVDFNKVINPMALSDEEELTHFQLMTVEKVEDSATQDITGSLTDDCFDQSVDHRMRLYVGEWKNPEGKGESAEAWLTYKATGGTNIKLENAVSAVIYAGKNEKNEPKQVPFTSTTHVDSEWYVKMLDNRRFTEPENVSVLGLTSINSREKAWKKVLFCVWAGTFPHCLILLSKDNDGESARHSLQGYSRKKQRKGRGTTSDTHSTHALTKTTLQAHSKLEEKTERHDNFVNYLQETVKHTAQHGETLASLRRMASLRLDIDLSNCPSGDPNSTSDLIASISPTP